MDRLHSLSVGFAALVAAATLAACDKAAMNPKDTTPAPAAPVRGDLVGTPAQTGSYSASDLLSLLPANDLGRQLLRLTVTPVCTVDVWRVGYHTVGGRDEPTTAATALMVPKGTDARCQGARPLLVYDHGTNPSSTFDMANVSTDNGEALVLATLFASQGYLVVAPNYAGYAGSTLGYHPYVVADQQANDTIDAVKAARKTFERAGATASTKLFLTGYSQGGYVAMATHRAMQAEGTAVTASAPMSGPYALAAFGDAIFLGRPNASAVTNFALLLAGYQKTYGNLYSTPGDVVASKYANGIESALPGTTSVPTLVQQGVLAPVLFSSTPPAPQYASVTPATQPSALAPVFAAGFGADALVTNAYRLAYLQDREAHSDGGFPARTDGLPPAAPANTLRQALKRNDLRNWTPTAPVLLCGGDGDPAVYWSNTELMQGYWAQVAPSAPVTVLDVDAPTSTADAYRDYRQAFSLAKAAVFASGGTAAVLDAYHAGLVPPVCLAAAKAFFDAR